MSMMPLCLVSHMSLCRRRRCIYVWCCDVYVSDDAMAVVSNVAVASVPLCQISQMPVAAMATVSNIADFIVSDILDV